MCVGDVSGAMKSERQTEKTTKLRWSAPAVWLLVVLF